MSSNFGNLVLFGSGETSPTGKLIHRKVLSSLPYRVRVAILETPAGFQPNSHFVASEVSKTFHVSLKEFVDTVDVISARKKGTEFSPDSEIIVQPLKNTNFIFLGPGSPTYALRQLNDSLALKLIIDRWRSGATLSMSSAAAIAAGEYTLPVYEIYKVGADLHWETGLKLLNLIDLSLVVVTHWNNAEGGDNLDTSRCFMGQDRFDQLVKLLPPHQKILGIDEHTAIIIDPIRQIFHVEGKGNARIISGSDELEFTPGILFDMDSISRMKIIPAKFTLSSIQRSHQQMMAAGEVPLSKIPQDVQQIIGQRDKAKAAKNFAESDRLRTVLTKKGYEVRDTGKGTEIFT